MLKGKKVLNWRVQVIGGQSFCYWDPLIERLVILPLTSAERAAIVECDSGDAFETESENAVASDQRRLPHLGAGYLKKEYYG